MATLESRLQSRLLLEAPAKLPHLRLFRRNVAKVRIQNRKLSFGIKGQCDIHGIIYGGRCVEIELKAEKGVLNIHQNAWRAWCEIFHVPYLLLRPLKNEPEDETISRWIVELASIVGAW